MRTWDEFHAELLRRKAARWPEALSAEPEGRPVGRRPRDPEQEALLAELDRLRIAESELLRNARRVPVDEDG